MSEGTFGSNITPGIEEVNLLMLLGGEQQQECERFSIQRNSEQSNKENNIHNNITSDFAKLTIGEAVSMYQQ